MLRGARLTKTVRITAKIVLILGVFSFVFGNFAENITPLKPKTAQAAGSSQAATRLYTSGFELNTTTAGMEYTNNVTTTPSIQTGTVRSGTYAMQTNAVAQVMGAEYDWATADNATRTAYRAYINISSAPGVETAILSFFDVGNTRQVGIRMNTDRTLELWNEEDNAQIGSASSALATSTWYRIELLMDFGTANTANSIARARLDGVEFASATNVNLANGAMTMQWGVLTSTTANFFWDDLAVNQDATGVTNNWPGAGKVIVLRPNGNGTNVAWTGDYTAVDEVTPNDATDVVSCSATGNIDDYTLEDFTSIGNASDTIRMLQPNLRVATATATNATYNLGFVDGSNTEIGTTTTVAATAWNTNDDTAPKNPKLTIYDDVATTQGGIITPTDVNSYQVRINTTDCNPVVSISTVWVTVEYIPSEGGRLWSSGFEQQSTTAGIEWDATAGTMSIDTANERSGAASLRTNGLASATAEYLEKTIASANDNGKFFLRTYLYITTAPTAENRIIGFYDSGGTVREYITLDSGRLLRLYDEDGAVGSASSALSTNTWYRIEMQFDSTAASGSHVMEARIDGTNFATASNRALTNGVTRFRVGANLNSEAQTQGDWNFDDVAINKNVGVTQTSYPGAGSIVHLKPNAAGDNTAWTSLNCVAADHTCVDEVTPNDVTDGVVTSTVGAVEENNVEDTATAGLYSSSITLVSVGVRMNISAAATMALGVRLKEASQTNTGISPIETMGVQGTSTTWFTNNSATPRSYPITAYTRPYREDAWTTTELDSMQIGVRETVDTASSIQVSAMWALVEYIPTQFTISGICKQFDKTTNCSAGLTVKANINGYSVWTGTTDGSGNYSISSDVRPVIYNSVHVWIDNVADASEAVGVAVFDGVGNDMTNIRLYSETLTIGSDDGTTVGWGELDNWDNSVSGDEDIFFDVNGSGQLTVDSTGQSTQERLYTTFGATFQTNQTVSTYNLESYGGFTVETGTTVNVAGSYFVDSASVTNWQSTSTLNMTSTTTGQTFDSGGDALVNLTFNGVGGEWTLSGNNITVSSVLTISNGNLKTSTWDITLTGSGTPFVITSGTFTPETGNLFTYAYDGSFNIKATTYYDLQLTTNNLGVGDYTQTISSGTLTINNNLTLNGIAFSTGNIILSGSSNNPTISVAGTITIPSDNEFVTGTGTVTLSNTGTPITITGTGLFTASSTSTVNYTGNGATITCSGASYHHLGLRPGGATQQTICSGAQTLTVAGNLTVGNGTNNGANADTNGAAVTVTGNVTINTGATFTIDNSASFTVGGNFTNSGTFSAPTGSTTVFNTTATSVITGSTTFYNFTSTTSTKIIQVDTGTTITTTSGGVLTLTNITLTRETGDSGSWTINHQGTESVTSVTVSWSACSVSPASTDITLTTSTDGGNNGACWLFPINRTISGFVYTNDETTVYGTVTAMKLSVNGATALTTNSVVTTGAFSFTVSNPVAGDLITIWLDTTGSGVQGTTVFKYGTSCAGTPDCTGIKVVRDQVRIENFHIGNIAISDLTACDTSAGTGCTDQDIGFDATVTPSLTIAGTGWATTRELKIASTATFAPGGNVTSEKLDIAGIYTGASETLSLGGAGTNTTCTDSAASPLCVTGTFTANGNTVVLDPTTNGSSVIVASATYNNLTLDNTNDAAGTANTFTLGGNATVSTQLKIGHSSSTNADTFSISTFTLTLAGSGSTTAQPLCINNTDCASSVKGLVTFTSGTVDFTGTSATNIALRDGADTTISYGNLGIKPGGAVTHTLGSAASLTLTVSGNLTLGTGSSGRTITAATNNPTINIGGNLTITNNTTYTKGTGITTFNGTTAATYTDSTSSIQNIGKVTLNKTSGTVANNKLTLASSITVDTLNIDGTAAQEDTLDMSNGGYTLTIANTGNTNTVFTNNGTFTYGNSTVVYTATNSAGDIDLTTVAFIEFYNLTLSGSENYTGTFIVHNTTTINSGATLIPGDSTEIQGDFTGAGTINQLGGAGLSILCGKSVCSFGPTGNNNWTFGFLYIQTLTSFGTTSITRTATGGSGNIITSEDLSIGDNGTYGATFDNETNDRTIDCNGGVYIGSLGTLQASSTASFTIDDYWINNGIFTAGNSTITFDSVNTGDSIAGTLTGLTGKFYNITFNNASGGWTFSNTAEVANNFTVTAGAVTAPTGNLTIGGNFTNTPGTTTSFAHNTGTVIFNDNTKNSTISGATTFKNLTVTTAGKDLLFTAGQTFAIAGTLTLTGSSGAGNDVTLNSTTGSSSWTINTTNLVSSSVTYTTVTWSACTVSSPTIDMGGTGNTNGNNNGACWIFNTSIQIQGNAYNDQAGTPTVWSGCNGSTQNISVSINGNAPTSGSCNASTGAFDITVTAGSNQMVVIFMNTNGGDIGTTYTKTASPAVTISGLKVTKDRIRLSGNYTFTNSNINTYDCDNDSDIDACMAVNLFTNNSKLLIESGATYAPGSNVLTQAMEIVGTYSGSSETLELNSGGTNSTCTNDYATAMPLCVNGGTFTAPTTTLFSKNGDQLILATTYNNLNLGLTTNSPIATLGSGTLTVNSNLTIGNGSNTNVTITAATNNPVINVTGNTTVSANTTFITGNGNFSTTGNLTVTGALTGSGSGTMSVNGSVSGAGTINLSGGTFEQRVNGASKTFGGGSSLTWTATEVTLQSGSGTQRITGMIFDRINQRYLAVGYDTGLGKAIVWESTNPASWTPHDIETSGSPTTGQIYYDGVNGKYLVTGSKSTDATVWESTNLTSWTARTVYSNSGTQNAIDIIYQNGTYVVAGNSDHSGNVDGYIWTATSLAGSWTSNLLATGSSFDNVQSVIYNPYDKLYVAVGEVQSGTSSGAAYVWESSNLTSWTARLVDDSTNLQAAYWIDYDKTLGKYLVYGVNDANGSFQFDQVLWSATTPSSTWTKTNMSTDANFESIHGRTSFNPATGRYVGAGLQNNNAILWDSTSPTSSWNAQVIDSDTAKQDAYSVTYDPINGRYIAGGLDQAAGNGDDAVIWYTSPTGWRFNNLTFGNTTGSSYTITTNGNVPFYVTGNLTIGKSGDTGTTTLDNETNDKGLTVEGNLTINSTGVLQASSTIPLSVGGSWSNNGTFTAGSSTVILNALTTGKTISGTLTGSTGKFNDLVLNGPGGAWTMSNNSELAGNLTIQAGTLSLGSTTITITGSSPINAVSSNFNFGTSTTVLTAGTSITVPNLSYYNLELKPSANSSTFTLASGAFNISNDLTLGNGSNTGIIITANTNNPTLDINGSIVINANTTFQASNTNDMTVAGSWTNSGTFSNGGRVVNFDGTGTGKTIVAGGNSNPFHDLTISGSGTWSVSTNALKVNRFLTVNTGVLQGDQNVTVLGGDVTGSGTINMTGGNFLTDGDTNSGWGGSGTWTFYDLTFGDGIGVEGTTTSGDSNQSINVTHVLTVAANQFLDDASGKNWTLSGSGTPIVNTGTVSFDSIATVTYSSSSGITAFATNSMTGISSFPHLVINATSGNPTFNAGTATSVKSDLTITNGTLNMGSNALIVGDINYSDSGSIKVASGQTLLQNSGTTTTILTGVGGTPCIGSNGVSCSGTTGSITFGGLVIGNSVNETNVTIGGTNTTISIQDILNVTSNSTLNGGSSTIALTGNGTVYSGTGTFTAQTSTIAFNSTTTTGTTIPALTYYNLTVNRASNTFTPASGTYSVSNNLTITAGTLELNTNDPTLTVTGNLTIGGTLSASNTNSLTIRGNFINNGTFTHNSGTVVINPTGTTSQVKGTTTPTNFYNFTLSPSSEKTIQFGNGSTYGFAGTVTIGGSQGVPVIISSDSAGVRWNINLTGTAIINYVYIKDSGCAGGTNNVTLGQNSIDGSNNGVCWRLIIRNGGGATGGGGDSGVSGGGVGQSGGGAGAGGVIQATGTAVLSSQVVISVTINSGGSGYVAAPNVCFSGGGGSGATATATISNGSVTIVNITAGGNSYISPPTVTFSGGDTPGGGGSGCGSGQSGGGQGGGGGGSP